MYRLTDRIIEKRFESWRELRLSLEHAVNPFSLVSDFFNQLPKVKVYTDPYDQSTWPTPWQLIEEHEYCPFNIILGICYTLQLCEKFDRFDFKITISIDKNTNYMYYLLFVNDIVYGYEENAWTKEQDLPKSLKNMKIYNMPAIH